MTPEQELALKTLGASLSEEVSKGLKTHSEQVDQLAKAVDEIKEEFKKEQAAKSISVPGVEKDKFSMHKCYQHVAKGGDLNKLEGYEGDVIRATMSKANDTLTPGAGGVYIPTEVSGPIIDEVIADMTIMKMGAQRLNVGGSSKISIPRIVSGSTAYWVDDLESITESALVFDNVDLEPHKLAAYVVVSNELLAQGVNIEEYINRSMIEQMGLLADLASLTGNGTKKPLGITQTADILAYASGATNGDAAVKRLYELLKNSLENANTLKGNIGIIGRPEHFQTLSDQTVANFSGQLDGKPLFDMFLSRAQLESQVGYPMASTTQLPLTAVGSNDVASLIMGDFSKLLVASWGNIELASSIHPKFQNVGTALRAVMRMDSAVLRPESFAVATEAIVRVTPAP